MAKLRRLLPRKTKKSEEKEVQQVSKRILTAEGWKRRMLKKIQELKKK